MGETVGERVLRGYLKLCVEWVCREGVARGYVVRMW